MIIQQLERRKLIGKTIRIYRLERKSNSQNEYTIQRFCKNICTENTLKRIELGEPCRENSYIELLKKFNLEYGYFPRIDEALNKLVLSLYTSIEFYNINDIIKYCDKALLLLEKVNTFIIYSELYLLFNNVKQYYDQDIDISYDIYRRYLALLNIFPSTYIPLFKILIIEKVQIIVIEHNDLYKETISNMNLCNSKYTFLKLFLLHYFASQNRFESLKEILAELEEIFLKQKNYIRLLDIYVYEVIMCFNIEARKREKCLEKIEELINTKNIYKPKVSEAYTNIACQFHTEENYDKSLYYFNKVINREMHYHITDLIYMANCQSHLNIKINIPCIEKIIHNEQTGVLLEMYQFYLKYDVNSAKIKQTIILEKIAPYNKDFDLIKVFRYEMRKIVKINSCYKGLYTYDDIVDSLMK